MKPTPTPDVIEALTDAANMLERLYPGYIDGSGPYNEGIAERDKLIARIRALSVQPAAAVVGEPVAWLHPTANWSDVDRQNVLNHCVKDGDMPVPLYAAPSAPDGWQPIETAPKDGSKIDLWGINHLHYAKQGKRVVNVAWGPVRDWMGAERDDWQHGFGEDFEPTHWCPIPAPPALGGKHD